MKFSYKLTDTGPVKGSDFMLVEATSPTAGRILDHGFHFSVLTDPWIDFGSVRFYATPTGLPTVVPCRLALNFNVLGYFNKQGQLFLPNSSEMYYNSTFHAWEALDSTMEDCAGQFGIYQNTHVYLWKETDTERYLFHVNSSGLDRVPSQVRNSWKSSKILYRFTIKPLTTKSGSATTFTPWSTNPSGLTLLHETPGGDWTQQILPPFQLFLGYYYSVPVRTKMTKSMTNMPFQSSTRILHNPTNLEFEGTFAFANPLNISKLPTALYHYQFWDKLKFQGSLDGKTGTSWLPFVNDHLESSLFFEGGSRDISIAKIVLNEVGDFNAVETNNNLIKNSYNANAYLSGISLDDDLILTSSGLDNLYVKV